MSTFGSYLGIVRNDLLRNPLVADDENGGWRVDPKHPMNEELQNFLDRLGQTSEENLLSHILFLILPLYKWNRSKRAEGYIITEIPVGINALRVADGNGHKDSNVSERILIFLSFYFVSCHGSKCFTEGPSAAHNNGACFLDTSCAGTTSSGCLLLSCIFHWCHKMLRSLSLPIA